MRRSFRTQFPQSAVFGQGAPEPTNLAVLVAGFVTLLFATILFAPTEAAACACGCGVFDVGAGALLPTGKGGNAYLEWDHMDQNTNWSGTSKAPAAGNADKGIRTDFYTAGVNYMFDKNWGVMVQAPVWDRQFKTANDAGGVDTFKSTAFGDVRVEGVYTGCSDNMSTGLIFGAKLPTGDYKNPNFDRDTEIGSGSTDLLLGGYHIGALNKDNSWTYFVQGMWDRPVAYRGGYRPGQEFDGAVGVYYNAAVFGDGKVKIAPILQLIAAARAHDSGPEASPGDSGYRRLMLSPGLELDAGDWRVYGDVEFPVYQDVRGNQLIARQLYRFSLSHAF